MWLYAQTVDLPSPMTSQVLLRLGSKDEITQTITSLWSGRSFGDDRTIEEAIEAYKLAYISAKMKKEKASDDGRHYASHRLAI